MYPSGRWRGFWVQELFGRQEMEAFELHFKDGAITGHGHDMVGIFVFSGQYDESNGKLTMIKKYKGKHSVYYEGHPDGEGCIGGTWDLLVEGIDPRMKTGPFLMRPEAPKITGDEPIQEI